MGIHLIMKVRTKSSDLTIQTWISVKILRAERIHYKINKFNINNLNGTTNQKFYAILMYLHVWKKQIKNKYYAMILLAPNSTLTN